ncbi:MAG: hypothetical protein ACI4XF_07715 [Oscillospiraceae bacterium]
MKKTIRICSFLCAVMALLTLIMGIAAITGHSFFIGIRLFSLVSNGGFTGFLGNLLGAVLTFLGFGALALYGFSADKDSGARKNAFIYGCIMTAVCVISAVFSLVSRSFTMGDIISAALPAIYTFAVFRSA